jgi:hypothetical protein
MTKHLLVSSMFGGVVGALLAYAAILGATFAQVRERAETISAREIRLVDQDGRCRAALAVLKDGAVALLFSASDLSRDGELRVERSPLTPHGQMLFGIGSLGEILWDVNPGANTLSRPSGYWLNSSASAYFLVDPSTTTNFASLGWLGEQPALRMWDSKIGNLRTVLAADQDGEPFLRFQDSNGRMRLRLGLRSSGEPSLVFYGKDGRPVRVIE